MLTSAQHHHHPVAMPVAASPCSTSSSSLGFQGSMNDLLNSSFGESSSSSVRSSPKRHHLHHLRGGGGSDSTAIDDDGDQQTVARVRTIRLRRPTAAAANVVPQPQQLQSRNLLIGGGNAVNPMELALIANQSNSLFGFSIRGGSEYRTGFFISHVEPASEADIQGILVGDQIIRVNNHPVDDATHKELSQYIANQSHLTLRVRNIGMIPVKDRDNDPLTWQMVHQDQKSTSSSDYDDIQCRDIVVTLSLDAKEKLGLGICKGPEWKPGIFVQFTKEHGIARRAGLKPGDQILSCNGVEFHNIFFNDAVSVMKSSSHLELIVRTAVGLELFPGESSGYNSSASSVTGGDQSPCWNESGISRRYDVEGRMNPNKMKSPFKPKSSSGRDRLMAVTTPKVPQLISFQNAPNQKSVKASQLKETYNRPVASGGLGDNLQNTTIIKLSEEGTIINNTLIPHVSNGPQKSTATATKTMTTMVRVESMGNGIEYCGLTSEPHANLLAQQESEHRTVVVEVHRGDGALNKTSIPPPPPPFGEPQSSSFPQTAIAAQIRAPPVANSIAEEIKKRAEALQKKPQSSIDERIQMKAKTNGYNTEHHCQLMDEFKKAHQKMFKNNRPAEENLERHPQLRNNEVDRDLPDSLVQVTPVFQASVAPAATTKNHFKTIGKTSPSPPPPPPPEPNAESEEMSPQPEPPIEFADDVPKRSAPSGAVTKTEADNHIMRRNSYIFEGGKPVTPTPDYDSLSYASSSEDRESVNGGTIPNPPPLQKINLAKQSSLGSTKGPAPPKPNRSISVTIGEYGRNGDTKREPAKLGFLNRNGGENKYDLGNTSEMLKNELQMTLSRSNLMKSGDPDKTPPKPPSQPNNHANGNAKSKSVLEKTGAANIERLTSMLNSRNQLITNNTSNSSSGGVGPFTNGFVNGQVASQSHGATNKVTIAVPKAKSEVKISPNGILKTANGSNGLSANSHNSVQANGEVKNIKFDNITTVIGIRK